MTLTSKSIAAALGVCAALFQPLAMSSAIAEQAVQYLDDRSTPQMLVQSYYNAINQKQYARAYGYYADNGSAPKDFQSWADGYSGTQHVSVQFGPTEADPGAGQIYWALPVALSVLGTDGSTQVFTGCYELHMTNPGIVTEPPYPPMGIEDGHFSKSDASMADAAAALQPLDHC